MRLTKSIWQESSKSVVALIAAFSTGLIVPLDVLADPMKLEEGVPVRLKLLDSISSGSNHQGDSVSFRVIDDVLASDHKTVLIKAGTPAWGSVSNLEERGRLGDKGQLSIAIEGTKSVDGKRVPLRASINREGQGKLGTVIALSFIITPLFLFMRGKDATISAGTQLNAYIDRDLLVDVLSAVSKTAVVDTPGTLNVSAAVLSPSVQTSSQGSCPNVILQDCEALDKLYDSGLLSKKEYRAKKKALAKKGLALKQ